MAKKNPSKQEITSIIGDLTFSNSNVWVWVKINPAQYEFQDYKSREKIARDFDLAISNLLASDEKNLECHLIVSSQPFNSKQWVQDLNERSQRNHPNPELPYFLGDMYNYVNAWDFREKVVYLGVNLGKRTDFNSVKAVIPLGPFSDMINSFVGITDEYVSEKELNFWDAKAKIVRTSLYTSRVKAQKVYAEDLAYQIRKNFYPAMPAPTAKELALGNPEVWGEGELGSLFDAEIDNNSRFLKMTQLIDGEETVGYRATLCFNKFPEVLTYPEHDPWIHYASLLSFPVDIYSRFTLEPSRKVRKEVERKLKEVQDQARNQTNAGGNVSLQIQEHLNLGTELDFVLSKNNTPWVFGRHRIIVEAPTEELLKERAQQIIDHYKALDIFVVWPTGDQLNLLMEGLPSDKIRISAYYQRQELSIISAGVPAGSGTVGDSIMRRQDGKPLGWIGPYLGHTTGRTVEPVFMSVHSAIAKNNPPGVVITGAPGGGKSFTAFTLTYQMALAGIWTIYIDPKADALPMVGLPGMDAANCRLIDLKDGNDGILDPFSIGTNPAEQKELALETIGLFIGGQDKMDNKQQSELAKAIQYISAQPQPSLNKIVDYLLASENVDAESLGQRLNFIRELPFARLCFNAKTADTLRADQGLTIITLLGLDLPNSTATSDTYTNSNRLAVAVMFLLTSFTRQLMLNLDKSHPKAIVIDEAWAITSTPQGAKLVFEVARMGRSLNTGLVLVSQNAGDFLGEGITNSVSIKLAFRATNVDEIDNVLRFFNLELNDANRDVIRELSNGECLIKDTEGRIARVQVDGWNEKMSIAFETNPETRKNN
jgi:hypothetical protein